MLLYSLYGISILLGTIANCKKIDKFIRIFLTIFSFLFLWVLLGWSYGANDVSVAINRYNNYEAYSSFTEYGYTFLIEISHRIGLKYRTFFVICSFFELLVMYWFSYKNSKKPLLVILLFMIYPMAIYFQYIRNILAFSIVLIGLDFLINKRKHYIVVYVLCILIGSLIHIDSLFFILYLPFCFMNKKLSIAITIVLFIILYYPTLVPVFLEYLEKVLGSKKADIVSDAELASGQFGRTFGIVVSLLWFWVVYFIFKIKKIELNDWYSNVIFRINLLSILFIPLSLYYGTGFARMPVLLSFINICFYCTKCFELKFKNDRMLVYSTIILFMFVLLFLNFRNIEYRELVLYPLFEQNELVSYLLGGD